MKAVEIAIKNQINQLEYKVCFLVLMLLSLGAFGQSCMNYYHAGYMSVRSAADNFILASPGARAFAMTFSLLLPLIASTTCAGCRKKNDTVGNGMFLMLRMNKKEYLSGNAFAVMILTSLTVFLILFLNQVLCLVAFPIEGYHNRFGVPQYLLAIDYDKDFLFDFWQIQNPYIYNLLYSLIISILCGGIAIFTYGVCGLRITSKYKAAQVSVAIFIFFELLIVIGQLFDIPAISCLSYIEIAHRVSLQEYLGFVSVIYLSGFVMVIKEIRNYEYI